ncbi:phosphoribosyltransferase family protein [Candidatus Mycobacterium wuenschmannii]|uniref:ribose-phosphate diphosphokinase n=1 Tax=Candidatus Mycobacterium wuenschmannii TaxID=3027808 RepID=A0ABY8VYW7_9MYCO|nr:phosphoribosyltransferase family protein [Candidatus Mycobacterium wuenschmannii]WIM87912.1 phosphoribosyltransferase family protein [Candidatus Mycobacterium wuenschmannii]
MLDLRYTFHALGRDNQLQSQTLEVFAYPMGDLTVRQTPEADLVTGTVQVLQVNGTAVDWALVREWAAVAEDLFPHQRRALALPYLPSARGDKDIPNPAVVNATFAASSGITDIIAVDPHSPVWLTALKAANPTIREHLLPMPDIVGRAVLPDGRPLGVISPDKGAVRRATDVATALKVPVFVASKNRDPRTGHLSNYSFEADLAAGRYLVVDDIFDGGGTFALLAGAVPDGVELDLWVTHGGFTKPDHSAEARKPYRRIYTTDSLGSAVAAGLRDNQIQVTPLLPWITEAVREIGEGR